MTYISETLIPLKSAIKPRKQTRFVGDPVTSVKTIPPRRTRPDPSKWTIEATDPDLLIPIELLQARTECSEDLGGNLSAVSPSESHQSEETLPNIPLGQFQAQEGNSTSDHSIAHCDTQTPSQSEIFPDSHNNIANIQYNNCLSTSTPSQREIFSETGSASTSSTSGSSTDSYRSEEATDQVGSESINNKEASSESPRSSTCTPSQSEIYSLDAYSTSTSSQSEIYSSNYEYDANSESSSREVSRPSSPESGNLTVTTLCSPLPEMALVTRDLHDAIHAVREQHGRAVTRHMFQQQIAQAEAKLQYHNQIQGTSTPDPPPMSNVPPRRPRDGLEKANCVTSGSSEDSHSDSNEPQTASKAWFMALKRRFETPPKMEGNAPSTRAVKRQKLYWSSSSQSATDCPPASSAQRTLPKYRGTSSEGD